MSQLGHEVWLIERSMFPRARLGESLTAGVVPLLELIGARSDVERVGVSPVSVRRQWDGPPDIRLEPSTGGLLVDRDQFDSVLLDRARELGVVVLQPARVLQPRANRDGWTLTGNVSTAPFQLRVDFVADARGRAGATGRRALSGPKTLALYAYWRGTALPSQPRIEAGKDAWYWGLPLPDGRFNTLAFVDGTELRNPVSRTHAEVFDRLVRSSSLLDGCTSAARVSPIRVADATPYLGQQTVTPTSIKIGDAAIALDPISSSGVQKAIQTALAGAVVVNTLLRRQHSATAAMQFYASSLEHAYRRHQGWAAAHYDAVARRHGGSFWQARAAAVAAERPRPSAAIERSPSPCEFVRLSSLLEFVDLPCIDGEFVTVKSAVRHPTLDEPLAFLGDAELAPLLRVVPDRVSPVDLTRAWSKVVGMRQSQAMITWLLNRRMLVPYDDLEAR